MELHLEEKYIKETTMSHIREKTSITEKTKSKKSTRYLFWVEVLLNAGNWYFKGLQ